MRICIPEIVGHCGAGLGNELFPWAKAFLASQALNAQLAHPAWGLNRRRYYRDFGTSRLDWLSQRILKTVLPTVHFDEEAYRRTGKDDYQQAVAVFAEEQGLARRSHFVFSTSGMWGGFHAIRKARVFVLSELLKARHAVHNVHAVLDQVEEGNALVAVHIRRGDFTAVDDDAEAHTRWRGRFNVALPLDWYVSTCAAIKRRCGKAVQLVLLTDASAQEVQPFIDEFRPLTTFHLRQTACSDLLLMAFADSIVCSVSSYSMWGAFLSNAPYLWYAPNLQDHHGFGSLWGHEEAQQGAAGVTARNLLKAASAESMDGLELSGSGRGVPVGAGGEVPAWFCEQLLGSTHQRSVRRDLIYYGAVRLPAA